MGWPIYVYAFVRNEDFHMIEKYHYVEVYGGRSWYKAIRVAIKAKRQGAGCVKIEWR